MTDGLILASVTIICTLITTFLNVPVVGPIIWLLKISGSIFLLYKAMKRYGVAVKVGTTFNYGALVCLFSSIVCAVYMFFHWSVIAPEQITIAFNSMLEVMNTSGTMTDEVHDLLMQMEENYAQYSCIFGFFYYSIFGIIVSAILNKSASAPKDIFAESDNTQNDDSDDE